jgi:murein DD-endopeptidase MepM/ murein hydrolase activator NlpD
MGGSWLCPVAGAHAFGNDYGDSRGGGRHHAGNDILATRGTPIVAPVAGTVTFRNVSLGGRSFFLGASTSTSARTFGIRRQRPPVSAGEVIGYVGDEGTHGHATPPSRSTRHHGDHPYPT